MSAKSVTPYWPKKHPESIICFELIIYEKRPLYSGGFFSDHDRRAMDQVRASSAVELAGAAWSFEDDRLDELLFRYRARNYPESLTPDERERWETYRYRRLTEADGGGSISPVSTSIPAVAKTPAQTALLAIIRSGNPRNDFGIEPAFRQSFLPSDKA